MARKPYLARVWRAVVIHRKDLGDPPHHRKKK